MALIGRVGYVRATSVNPAAENMATVPVEMAGLLTRAERRAATSSPGPPLTLESSVVGTGVDPVTSRFSGGATRKVRAEVDGLVGQQSWSEVMSKLCLVTVHDC